MAETTQFTIGTAASCTDGVCGELSRVVVDPITRTVTHLVIEPTRGLGLGRLVPLDLVEATSGEVRLRCSAAEFEQLDAADETRFLTGGNYLGYGPGEALSWPYYGMGMGGLGMGGLDLGMAAESPQTVIVDAIPQGEVDVRRGDQVEATDGGIGRVQGLVIDRRDRRVTHVLLQEGHLWGRKEVAIPIGAVSRVDDGIRLNITKQQVQDLPAVDIDHPDGEPPR